MVLNLQAYQEVLHFATTNFYQLHGREERTTHESYFKAWKICENANLIRSYTQFFLRNAQNKHAEHLNLLLLPFNSLPFLFSGPTKSFSARCQSHLSYSLMHLLAIPLSKAPLGLQIQNGKFHACWRVLCKVKHPNGPFIMHRARNMPAINTVGKPIFSPSGNQINPGGAVVSTVRLIIAGIFVSLATPDLIFRYVSQWSGVGFFCFFWKNKKP